MLDIPPILYTSWSGDEMGPLVRRCIDSMRRWYPVVVLNDNDLPDEIRKGNWSPEIRSDYARISALASTGGVWMDASSFVFDDAWTSRALELPSNTQVIGFRAPWDADVLENWALAAPSGSVFMTLWRDEFARALKEGPENYCQRVKDQTPASLHPSLPYLSCHAAAAVVRSEHPELHLHLSPSVPVGPFGVHDLFQFEAAATVMYILTQPADRVYAVCGSFCKLRGVERNTADRIMATEGFVVHPDSIFQCSNSVSVRYVALLALAIVLVAWIMYKHTPAQ